MNNITVLTINKNLCSKTDEVQLFATVCNMKERFPNTMTKKYCVEFIIILKAFSLLLLSLYQITEYLHCKKACEETTSNH